MRVDRPPTIGVVGNLCNLGHEFARRFSAAGTPARLVTPETGLAEWQRAYPDAVAADDPYLDVVSGSPLQRKVRALTRLRSYDLLFSICLGGLPALPFLGRPYVSYATGADLRELAMGLDDAPAWKAAAARRTFRQARFVFHSPDHGHVEALDGLGVSRRVGWRQFVDIDYWGATATPPVGRAELVVFTPTSQAWRPAFPGQGLKRNDVLFEGFARFVAGGGRGELRYLRRGQDAAATEELIDELGIRDHVRCVGEELGPQALRRQLAESDVVGDQFGVGTIGLIALEAMAAGRPIVARFDADMVEVTYPDAGDRPPLRSVATPDEVAGLLAELADPAARAAAGHAAADWVRRVHDPDALAAWYLRTLLDATA